MGCNCGKKKDVPVVTPVPSPIPVPQTPEELHAQEMEAYIKQIEQEHLDKLDNQ